MRAARTRPPESIHQTSGSLVEEPTAAFWAFLLLLLLEAGECRDHGTFAATTTERFCDTAAELASEAIGGCTSCDVDIAVASGGADFGGLEAFFYCSELGFEAVSVC